MTPRFVRPCVALLLVFVATRARAQPAAPGGQLPTNPPAAPSAAAAPATANPDDPPVRVQLPDADLDTILQFLERLTGRIILRPAALPTATYNLKITQDVPRSAAIRYIETILALNGIGLVPLDDRSYKVTALTMARMQAPELITDTTLNLAPSGRIATKLFQLEFLRVQEILPLLQGVMDLNLGGPQQIPNANAFLITDSITNLQRVEVLLQQIDKPVTAGMKPKFYQLKHGAKASDVVTKLRTILQGTLQTQLGSATSYSADDRTNQIILVTDPRQYPFFDELIEKLDIDYAPTTRNDVIHLSHAKAEEVVTVITRLIQSQNAAIQSQRQGSVRPGQLMTPPPAAPTPNTPTPAPVTPQIISAANEAMGSNEFSGIMTVVNDNRTNSVVASGTADDIRLLRELVAKLDIVLAQVRIEIVIAEVSLDDQNQTGISALGLTLEGDKLVAFSGALASESLSIAKGTGTITRPGKSGHMDLGAEIAIATTPRKDNSTIFSVPAVVGSHGKQTVISNGEKRPIITGTVSSGQSAGGLAQSSQITQQQIGTTLTVTPYIGADGSVQLDIKQTVEDVTGRVIIDGNEQPVIGSREITSYSTAKSGEIIVLGGFTKRIDSKTSSRLGPIPILGDIFGARTKRNFRQEILFFLRPTVLTNNPAIDNAPALRKVEALPQRDEIKKQIDPNYAPPKKSIIDRILPK